MRTLTPARLVARFLAPLPAVVAMLTGAGCATKVSLENPYAYRTLAPSERLPVPCVFHVRSPGPGTLLEEDGYQIDMAKAVSSQLRAALLGLCRGARETSEPAETVVASAKSPLLVLDLDMRGGMDATGITWGMNTGWADGSAVVSGAGAPKRTRTIEFGALGKRRTYYAEAGVGAEGLRNALGLAVQDLVDQMGKQRDEMLMIAGYATGPIPPPSATPASR